MEWVGTIHISEALQALHYLKTKSKATSLSLPPPRRASLTRVINNISTSHLGAEWTKSSAWTRASISPHPKCLSFSGNLFTVKFDGILPQVKRVFSRMLFAFAVARRGEKLKYYSHFPRTPTERSMRMQEDIAFLPPPLRQLSHKTKSTARVREFQYLGSAASLSWPSAYL